VKAIKNSAVINESATDKLIRELKEENERLKKMSGSGGASSGVGLTDEEKEEMERVKKEYEDMMAFNKAKMEEMEKSYAEKLKASAQIAADNEADEPKINMKNEPHLINLNEDPFLSGQIKHAMNPGWTKFGKKNNEDPPQV
jgi:kinesin family protein 1